MTPAASGVRQDSVPVDDLEAFRGLLLRVGRPFAVFRREGRLVAGPEAQGEAVASVPAVRPENLGDASFRRDHGLRYNYLAGAMANGIGSVEVVEAMSRAGMLAFFGAAGLSPRRVEEAIGRLQQSLGSAPHGFNLIHSPAEPALEAEIAGLYRRQGVRLVEASAYLDLTLPLVGYRLAGIRRHPNGEIDVPNRVIAKVSRVEVATRFLSPAAPRFLKALVESGDLTAEQARLAEEVPVAQDLTGEADSGGHTDNRPAITLIPTLIALRDRIQAQRRYAAAPRIGAAGGIATPASAAAAFAMGASYVLTGSVNQACVESGSSDTVRDMLAAAQQADTAMAPAADMFEMGVKVQVLKRGTMFAMRAAKLYEIYKNYGSLEEIPAPQREALQKDLFRASVAEVWDKTRAFFLKRDPSQVERAGRDPKHRMALVFRWYLGLSSRWANAGEPSRAMDYQIWCGPAMGAFNEWVRGSFLEDRARRRVADIAANILVGAAVLTRLHILRCQGIAVDPRAAAFAPRPPQELEELLSGDMT